MASLQREALLIKLEEQKPALLAAIRAAVHDTIAQESTHTCLTFVTKDNNGNIQREFEPALIGDYPAVLLSFMNRSGYDGYHVDSVLTNRVVAVVQQRLEVFYADNAALITAALLSEIAQKPELAEQFVQQMMASAALNEVTDEAHDQIHDLLFGTLMQQMYDVSAVKLGSGALALSAIPLVQLTTSAVTTLAATPLAQGLYQAIAQALLPVVKALLGKLMTVPLFKTIFETLIQKFALSALLSAFTKLIGAKVFGLSISFLSTAILLPIIAIWLGLELARFPQTLAAQTADSLQAHLDENLNDYHLQLTDALLAMLIGQTQTIAPVLEAPAVQTSLKQVIQVIVED